MRGRGSGKGSLLAGVLGLAIGLAGCGDSEAPCVEDIRAAHFDETREVTIGETTREAAYADPALAARGLRHRVCAIPTLVFDYPPAGVWTCGVTTPLDVIVASETEVIAVYEALAPCEDPDCGSCATYGAGLDARWVVEWPAGRWAAQVGDVVEVR